MPKEIYPSSYLCDCGHQSDFFENTIKENQSGEPQAQGLLGGFRAK